MTLAQLECSFDIRLADDLSLVLEEEALSVSWYETNTGNWHFQVTFKEENESLLREKISTFFREKDLPVTEIKKQDLLDKDWMVAVYQGFPPLTIGKFYIYGSHIKDALPVGLIPLQIEAATAFGSGQHESTEGCLTALSFFEAEDSFSSPLDMGCGSGILALAMANLWNVPVLACDNDPEAVRVTLENGHKNSIGSLIHAQVSEGFSDISDKTFDIITANILAGPLCQMAENIKQALRPDGFVILSGLLNRQAEDVIHTYRSIGIKLVEQILIGEWSTLIMKKEKEWIELKALREIMEERNLAALLIPRTDEFQGEYIAPPAQRLAWLTGFTGSAGFSIISKDKAAFFTDGRYILQATQEVPSVYEHYNISQYPPSQWVLENLSPDEKVGYDPWLFTEAQLEKYDRPLVPLDLNPIDILWKDRPAPLQIPLRLHSLSFAGETDKSKRIRIAATLQADQMILTACDSIAWLLNIRGDDVPHTPIVHSICILRKDSTYDLFVDLNKVNQDILTFLQEEGGHLIDISQVLSCLKRIKGPCQLDPQTTPMLLLQTLEQTGVKIIRERDPCLLPKALKNTVELKGAKEAHIQDGVALCRFFQWLSLQPLEGEVTELSAAEKLYEFRKKGQFFQDISFGTISGFGAHGAIIHYSPTTKSNTSLTAEGLYLLDSGGQYLTGTTDVTRTLSLGRPTAEQKDRYTRVLKGNIALAQAIFPAGTTGAQLDSLARQFLWQVGCNYDHGTGHGVGSYLSVHEGPQSISKRVPDISLQPGMILSNEPGYYKEGEYGIRIENLMRVIKTPGMQGFYGFETLTLVPLDLNLVAEELLTQQEKIWIENYHKHIFNTLAPYLEPEVTEWLRGYTAIDLFRNLLAVCPERRS